MRRIFVYIVGGVGLTGGRNLEQSAKSSRLPDICSSDNLKDVFYARVEQERTDKCNICGMFGPLTWDTFHTFEFCG
jgi:hypothetical protein